MEKKTNGFVFDNFQKMCCLTVGDTIETNDASYKVADFLQIILSEKNTQFPGHVIITETGEKIISKDVIKVIGVEYVCLGQPPVN